MDANPWTGRHTPEFTIESGKIAPSTQLAVLFSDF